jgi:two-component system cell cycle sensor histidine kinase/response regulator CckA
MTEKTIRSDQTEALRQRAENIAWGKAVLSSETPEAFSPEEAQRTLHELQVHQIELEVQNEELRRTQGELEASRARYFDLYDLAPVGYFTVSEAGLIQEANLTAANLLGVTRVSLVNQPLTHFILPADQDIYFQHRKQMFEPGESQVCELRMLHQDGTSFWARLDATVVQDTKDAPAYRVVLSNISDRKQAEAERAIFADQNRQLQKAESLGRMAGAIAHHFNNQLGVVIGNLELAMMDLSQKAIPHETIIAAMNASNKAAEMSNLMLTYLGQSLDKREALDLAATCLRSLPMLQAVIPGNALLETDLPSPGPVIMANANQILQILTNLITNAWEAIGEGQGAITLSVKTVLALNIPAVHRFPLNWQPQHHIPYACLEVADNGCGIQDMDMEKLFAPFFSSKFTGRGMGLSVVLGIVRAHGGVVTVESEPGRSSAVRVFFPVAGEVSIRQPQRTASDGNAMISKVYCGEFAGAGTLLLIEDEEQVRDVAAAMIKRLGFSVLEAKDGIEAVELFHQRHDEIRLVLCDLTMPRMNGWETLTALRKQAPDIPVVLASGYDEEQVMAGEHTERPQVFLGKPYNLQRLSDAIRRALINEK